MAQAVKRESGSEMESGADQMMRAALDSGINVCFANPGTTEMNLVAALDGLPEIRAVLCLQRARSPVLTLVGQMATWHQEADPVLAMDITALAKTVSGLEAAGRICAASGAVMLCEGAFARLDRGCGHPCPSRLPYFPQEAKAELDKYDMLVIVGSRPPVANFGYKDGLSILVGLPEDKVWEVDAIDISEAPGHSWAIQALKLLQDEVEGATGIVPLLNCNGTFCAASRPDLPAGRLNATSLCTIVAAVQPEGCIIVDESLTSGGAYYNLSKGCPPFTHLTLTGGAIGCGPPMAVGAAIAAGPNKYVINLQADGSAMYTIQALWTQAREQLNVVTIICANSSYQILKVESARQQLTNGSASRTLTDLSRPALDFVALAEGLGVPAFRTHSSTLPPIDMGDGNTFYPGALQPSGDRCANSVRRCRWDDDNDDDDGKDEAPGDLATWLVLRLVATVAVVITWLVKEVARLLQEFAVTACDLVACGWTSVAHPRIEQLDLVSGGSRGDLAQIVAFALLVLASPRALDVSFNSGRESNTVP
eukprot:gene13924-19854_t